MTEVKFLKVLKTHIFNNYGTQSAAAREWGVSCNYVSLLVNGIRSPNKEILDEMGYQVKKRSIKIYEKVK